LFQIDVAAVQRQQDLFLFLKVTQRCLVPKVLKLGHDCRQRGRPPVALDVPANLSCLDQAQLVLAR
jgi:hypothetical protein